MHTNTQCWFPINLGVPLSNAQIQQRYVLTLVTVLLCPDLLL